jgi:CheY-like chemotaxis protein
MRELMEHRACEKRVPLAIQATTPIPATIYSDTTRVYQILINLLGNAIKFTDKGEVRLDVRLISEGRGSPRLEFVVSDTGIGMTQEQLARLFQPFAQADHSITERFGGTGLGLSVSKRLANLLGGDIRVQSEPGRGSTFVFELPTGPLDNVPLVQTIEPRPTAVQAPANTSIRLDRSTRVLLAEDGPDNQRLISLILRKAGAEVSTVENGQAAVETAMDALHKGTPFDVVLMDMHMPVLDGFAAVRQLRQAGYAHPIIALTAEAMRDDRNKCLSAGCDDYASKPIQRDVLLALVAHAASRRAAGLMKK